MPFGIDSRNYVERETRTRCLHRRGAALSAPGPARMMVRPSSRLVCEENQGFFSLRTSLDLRIVLFAPLLHQFRLLLPGPIQRALRAEPWSLQGSSHRYFAQSHAKFLSEHGSYHRQYLQHIFEFPLKRILVANDVRKLLHLSPAEFRRFTGNGLDLERLFTTIAVSRQPAKHRASIDVQPFCSKLRDFVGFYALDRCLTQLLFRIKGQLSSSKFFFGFHASRVYHEAFQWRYL